MSRDKKMPRTDYKSLKLLGLVVFFFIVLFGVAGVFASKGVLDVSTTVREEFCSGVLGSYYSKSEPGEDGIKMIRIDKKVAFDWGLESPHKCISADNFSVVWSGFITPAVSGEYLFRVYSDDGVRLYVDSVKLIDRWEPVNLEMTVARDRIYLKKGEFYPFCLEYKEHYINSTVYLFWEAQGVELSVVPENCFYVKREIYDKYNKAVYIK